MIATDKELTVAFNRRHGFPMDHVHGIATMQGKMLTEYIQGYRLKIDETPADCGDSITADMLSKVRCEIPDLIEIVGEVSSQLAEAIQDIDHKNLIGGQIVADDALESLARLESKVSEMQAAVAKWLEASKTGGEA